MIALIKTTDPTDMIIEPFPEWLDPVAYAIYDCYGYALCNNYEPPQDDTVPKFEFSTMEIVNPYRQEEDDPEKVMQRVATQIA